MRPLNIRFLGSPGGAGGQTINADYVASSAAVYQPTITTVSTITADYVSSASQVYQPTVTVEQTIAADYLASAAQVYQPTLNIAQTISADYVASAAAVYQPALTTLATIEADYVGSSSQVYQPTVTVEQTIAADYLASAAQVYQPTLSTGLVLDADYVASAAQVYQPTITTTATINADYVASSSQVYQPTLEATLQTIDADYVASASAVYQPTITGGATATVETATGGWFDYWQPTKEQIRKERERLGIIKPEIDQIIRVIKKVSKGQISPQEAKQEAQTYFAKQDLQFFPKHEEAVDNLVSFLTQQTGYNPVEYAAQKAQEAARQAQADQEYQELVLELQAQRDAIEEQDMVFVITCLAA